MKLRNGKEIQIDRPGSNNYSENFLLYKSVLKKKLKRVKEKDTKRKDHLKSILKRAKDAVSTHYNVKGVLAIRTHFFVPCP